MLTIVDRVSRWLVFETKARLVLAFVLVLSLAAASCSSTASISSPDPTPAAVAVAQLEEARLGDGVELGDIELEEVEPEQHQRDEQEAGAVDSAVSELETEPVARPERVAFGHDMATQI